MYMVVYFIRLTALFFEMERDKRKVTERKTLLFGLNNNPNNKGNKDESI